MCGIAGLLGVPNDLARAAAPRMLAAVRHRGPDDLGTQYVPDPHGRGADAVLLHARLSILDLTPAGHQPMADRPRTPAQRPNWIVFNGEVFNYLDFHKDLEGAGWPCHSRSDTEVILHSYRAWGEAGVERMRGMFAWCLLDGDRGQAWFCRDRLGIKPLYLYRPAGGGLLFASEVRALLAAGPELVPPRVSAAALESFLAQGAVCGLDSIIAGVEMLGPGESLVTDWAGRPLRRRAYWHLPAAGRNGHAPPDRPAAVQHLAGTLREAVRLRLIADVPVGLFLSGGIDSTAVAALATEAAGTRLQSLSIGFDQPEFDETEVAAATARRLGTDHQCLRLTGAEVLADLPEALAAVDQPTVDGFNTYFVSRAARRAGLKVALSGLGGDELFGGYASFRDVPRALAWRRRLRWLGPIQPLLARAAGLTGGRRGLKAEALFGRPSDPVQMYLLRRELFPPADRRALLPLPDENDPFSGIPQAVLEELASEAEGAELTNQVSRFELSSYMRHMLLRDADVFSMSHGLEVRVPLLDHRVVEEVAALPGAFKRPDPRPKPLLLDAVGERLPAAVYQRPKQGFTFPWAGWLRGALRERAARAAGRRDVWAGLGLNADAPAKLWQRFADGDGRVSALQVLALVVLEDFAEQHGLQAV